MISTCADLVRFYRAIMLGELFPQRQLKEMLTTVAPDGAPDGGLDGEADGSGYGLGIVSRRLPCGVTVWGHNGEIFGSTSEVTIVRDGRRAVAFNTNADWVPHVLSRIDAEFCR
jgi:D-alanyl-D-alanine carboxypeptidase